MDQQQPACTAEDLLLGHWTLVSNDIELQSSGCKEPLWPCPARGHLIFLPHGRMMVYLEACERVSPAVNRDFQSAYSTMCAYTGRYWIDGNRWVTAVDGAWNVRWVGTEQIRFFELSANTLHVTSDWYTSILHESASVRAHLVWTREYQLPGAAR